jgi:tripartite-type tricarboxylate transporter receptor subunit TctC
MSERMAGMARRRSLMMAVLPAAMICAFAPYARADDYPSRAITLIVPYPAGGGVDAMARLVAAKLSAPLGQQMIVENRGGGGGNIGARAVAKAAPDGYTLLLGGAGSITINPSLDPNAGYIAKDFALIGLIASMPVVITVHPSVAAHSVADLIALAKEQPGRLDVGTPNRGSGAYLAAELFKAMAGVDLALIPYKGAAPLTNDLIAGHIGIGFNTVPPALGNIQSGNLRPIAVTSATRTSLLPDVPTVAESGLPGFEAMLHFGLLAPAAAQSNPDYPNKPVRIIVNVAPGGGVDTATRIIADKLRARLGQPFVVENRPGAGGNIGAEVVFQSEGDGYTLLASSPTPLAINGWLYKKLNFDPAGFEPVAMMSRIPNVLVVRSDFPAQSVQEFVTVAKANPGKFSFGSQGIGTASHLTGELFMTLTGTKLVHVPYKGNTSNVLTDVIAGHVDLSFIQFSAVHELQQGGKLRVLAVATDKRMEALPDVPTMAEAGYPDIVSETWNAISAPPKTPGSIILKLNAAINEALQEPEVLARLRELQVLVGGGDAAQTRRFVEEQRALWGKVIQAASVPQQ